ncbi:MAG: hypothetical protein C5B54_01230 [Acidobacteria bacterium]|nr:MAG: hypothetical protein C5B54_01230 [Acidobacteriota bacterium]
MKKIGFALALLLMLGLAYRASAQQDQQKQDQQKVTFYYYPSSNIYYNVSTGEYLYYDEPTTKWITAKTLPTTITLEKMPVDTVYYNGPDVWKDNPEHLRKYKAKKEEVKKKD